MITAAILTLGYTALWIVAKWVSWHFEDREQITFHFHWHTEDDCEDDHGGRPGSDGKQKQDQTETGRGERKGREGNT